MIKRQILGFVARWILSSIGMWICISLFGKFTVEPTFWIYILAGLVFSFANAIVRPLAMTLTLPLVVFSMGLSTILINAGMVALAFWLTPGVKVELPGLIYSTAVLSTVNGLINFYIAPHYKM
ncbi:MAG: phage holin family protein [Candidatus Saccharibacteria bacterium]|nr:phage holin family protein [Candidatus Saccharibacteria bacterium]